MIGAASNVPEAPRMAKLIGILMLLLLVAMPVGASAHDAYDDSESHPLRLAAYALNPVGYALEWLVMRPIHFVVSQPRLEPVFGHVPHENPFGNYEPYQPDQPESP
jgi:hypothetical protein